jgi:hypothetical protein
MTLLPNEPGTYSQPNVARTPLAHPDIAPGLGRPAHCKELTVRASTPAPLRVRGVLGADVEGRRISQHADMLRIGGPTLPVDVCPSRTPLAHSVRAHPLAAHTVTAVAPEKVRLDSAIIFAASSHACLLLNSMDPIAEPEPEPDPASMMMST